MTDTLKIAREAFDELNKELFRLEEIKKIIGRF